jgi:sRNA-binding protein
MADSTDLSTDHLLHHKRAMAKSKTKTARQRPNQRASSEQRQAKSGKKTVASRDRTWDLAAPA